MRRSALPVLILATAIASPAFAQRRGRPAAFRGAAEERSIDRPQQAEQLAPGTSRRRPLSYLREQPDDLALRAHEVHDLMVERLIREREQLVVSRRAEALRLLQEFVAEEPEQAPEMPDALLRLAELLWEQARVDYLRVFAAWQELPAVNRGREPRPEYGPAMRLYDRLLRHHRAFHRFDLVLYMKAYALVELGNPQGALTLYRRILSEVPNSRFVPDAHMALAESHFVGRYHYAAALAEYELVLEHPGSGLYDIALFKSAWCLWRLGRSQQAARRFRQVLDLSRRTGLTDAQRRRLDDLQEEALDYLIQVFVEDESNSARDVFTFVDEIGGEQYAYRILGKLSETYFDQARYEKGIEAYRLLLENDPTSARAPEYQERIAEGFGAVGNEVETVAALRALAAYGPDSDWAGQQADAEAVVRTRARAERAVRAQALQWHEEGQRANQNPKLEQAAALYGVYMEHFANDEHAYTIQFYRAEILFHRLRRYPEAGDAYLAAARLRPRGDMTRDALYNAIGAFEHVRDDETRNCGRPDGGGTREACDETDNDRKFSEAIGLYVELYPEDPDLPEILLRQGQLYFDRHVYDAAVRLWGQLLERFPDSRYAAPAGERILDSFNRAQDYSNIEAWARRLKDAPAFESSASQRRLDGLIVQAVFKIGEQLAERGEHAEAANAYFRAAEEFPEDARSKQAFYNAGIERQRGGDLAGAAVAFDRLIERYPRTEEGALGAWTAAQMYESIAQFSDAARYYEAYAEHFPRARRRADALYNAVLLRVSAGDHREAIRDGTQFVRRHSRHRRAAEVHFLMGRAHEAARRWRDAARVYQRFIRRARSIDRKIEANTRLAQALVHTGQRGAANRALQAAVRLGRRHSSSLRGGVYYAAQARYLQGDQVLAEYEAVQIRGDAATLRQRLEQKAELLQRAAVIYADVVEFRVAEWVTAALFQIGRSFELFADALREAPIPPGLNEEEEQSYRDQLAMFVVPMEERALEAYEGGYQKALELRIFNRWTARLFEALTRLNDVQYPPLREMGGEIVGDAPLAPPELFDGLRRGRPAAPQAAGAEP